jgi:hypothetical protein
MTFKLYLPGKKVITVIRYKARVVKNLKINFLIRIDILGSKRIDLILS